MTPRRCMMNSGRASGWWKAPRNCTERRLETPSSFFTATARWNNETCAGAKAGRVSSILLARATLQHQGCNRPGVGNDVGELLRIHGLRAVGPGFIGPGVHFYEQSRRSGGDGGEGHGMDAVALAGS